MTLQVRSHLLRALIDKNDICCQTSFLWAGYSTENPPVLPRQRSTRSAERSTGQYPLTQRVLFGFLVCFVCILRTRVQLVQRSEITGATGCPPRIANRLSWPRAGKKNVIVIPYRETNRTPTRAVRPCRSDSSPYGTFRFHPSPLTGSDRTAVVLPE
jgi:hypothetical protein